MITVRQLLARQGDRELFSIRPDAPVIDAIRLFAEHNLGSLLVVRDGHLLGIVTERDYARKVILRGRSSYEMTVWEIMSWDVTTAHLDSSVEDMMRTMLEEHVRHLPIVTDDGNVIAVLSIRDAVESVLGERDTTIHQLTGYMCGSLAV